MLYLSNQPELKKDNIFEEYYSLPPILNDLDAKYYLGKLLRENLGFTWEMLTEHKLFFFQEMLINAWFKKDYSLWVACRGSGKSFLIAVFCCLYCIFYPRSRIVIVANVFRSVKSIFTKIDEFLKNKHNALLRQCFPTDMSKANDIYTQKCVNGSVIIGLPLSGENLRGQRANVLLIDEGLLVSEHMMNSVLRPFLNSNLNLDEEMMIADIEKEMIKEGILAEENRTRFPKNKMIVCTSAATTFDFIFEKIYNPYIAATTNHSGKLDDPSYCVCRMSYHIPVENGVVLDTSIKATIESGSEHDPTFLREAMAQFTDLSGNFFNMRKVKEGQVPDGCYPTVQLKGDRDGIYILGIDPSYSASESSDFFAMSLCKIDMEEKKVFLVHSFGKPGVGSNLEEPYEYLTYLLLFFNINILIVDASGQEFIQSYNQSALAKEHNINLKTFTANMESDEYTRELKTMRSEWNIKDRCIVYPHLFNSKSNRATNEYLQSQINAGRVCFGSKIMGNEKVYNMYKNFKTPFDFYDRFGEKYDIIGFIEDQDDWQEQVKAQLALIQVTITSNGVAQYGMPSYMEKRTDNPNRPRKDNYTALMMCVYAAKFLFDLVELDAEPTDSGFAPFWV